MSEREGGKERSMKWTKCVRNGIDSDSARVHQKMGMAILGQHDQRKQTQGGGQAISSVQDRTDEGRQFLKCLERTAITISPNPVVVGSQPEDVEISLRSSSPPDIVNTMILWQLSCNQRIEPIIEKTQNWPKQSAQSPSLITPISLPDEYQVICEVEIDGIGSRVLTQRFTARNGTLESARSLSDDRLLAEYKALRRQVATESDPTKHAHLLASYHHIEWLAHERGIQSHEDWSRKIDFALGDRSVPTDAESMRAYVEQCIVDAGRIWGGLQVRTALAADDVTPEQRALGDQQLEIALAELDALEDAFDAKTMRMAWNLLDESSRQIGDVLRGYGLSVMVDDLILQLARGDVELDAVAHEVMTRSKGDIANARGNYESKAEERTRLSTLAAELTAQSEHLHSLYVERTSLMEQRQQAQPLSFERVREHPSHHQRQDALRESRVLELIPPSVLAAQPEFAGMMARANQPITQSTGAGVSDKVVLIDLWLQAVDADIRRAQISYQTRWLEAEREHPILVAYREKPGQTADFGTLTGADNNDELMDAVLSNVLPKLANIAKAQTWLKSGHLDPKSLPPVVTLARQSLQIVPGTMRARVVDDIVADATDEDNHWAIAAITLGLAVLTAIPSGGSSAVLLAELGLLGLDAYLAMESYADFAMAETAANTSIDPARALSSEEPSLTWLAVQLVAVGLGLGFATKTFREAARLRRTVEAGESGQDAVRHLDDLGEQHGLGKMGSRVVRESSERGGDGLRVVKPGLFSDRVGEYATENVDGLARRLGTGVQVDLGLGTGVRIDRFVHADGDVWIIGIRVGPGATTADVLAHRKTIALMRRYNGAVGDLRAVLDRGLGKVIYAPGSVQEIATLEAEKLRRLIRERQSILEATAIESAAPVLEREIAFLYRELEQWERRLLSREPSQTVSGFGEIGSPDFDEIRIGKGNESDWLRTKKNREKRNVRRERRALGGEGERFPRIKGKPRVADPKLQLLIDMIYKAHGRTYQIGAGSTADAIRFERLTGRTVVGRGSYDVSGHTIKGQDMINALNKWLANHPDGLPRDHSIAKKIIRDLQLALKGY